ncbi:MAG: MATE family efflux transporter [Acholeplasmatales bacterium]|nr:MATE family efflux transporter [Acholeplasmatales bacterium]
MKNGSKLTEGSPFKTLLIFSLPMILSVTLQQFYNICDSLIAGSMISDNALSAVSASYPITVVYLAIAVGFGVGANIITARLIGQKSFSSAKESIYTSLITIALISVFVSALGLILLKPILFILNVDGQSYYSDAFTYLLFYTLGLLFLFLYNVVTSLFQSMGNSRIPLYLLIFSTVLNLILDIIFVKAGYGIKGISIATFISQAIASIISFIILIIYVKKTYKDESKLFNKRILRNILSVAIPSIIQGSIISIGGVLVQSLINSYGSDVTAGYGAAYKIVYVIVNIYTVMSNAISTFTSTNAGAKKYDRIKKGFYSGLLICFILTLITTLVFMIIPKQLLGIFGNDDTSEEVVKVGVKFIYCVAPFYIFLCIKIPCDGVLKGSRDMRSFMIATFVDLVLRVGLAYILGNLLPKEYQITGIFLSWPIGWAVGMSISLIAYRLGRWKKLIGYENLTLGVENN